MDGEAFTYLRAILALAFVTGLIYLLAAVIKKTGLDKKISGGNNNRKTLSISETMYLDPRNRLVLVKHEDKEHLLLLGAAGNILIESRTPGDKA